MTNPTSPAAVPGSPPAHDAVQLAEILAEIQQHDTDYETRYGLVLDALPLAHRCGYLAGIRIDPAQPEWPTVYIELPTGQVSWHMPQHPRDWDGHSTEQKYSRIAEFTAAAVPVGMALADNHPTHDQAHTELAEAERHIERGNDETLKAYSQLRTANAELAAVRGQLERALRDLAESDRSGAAADIQRRRTENRLNDAWLYVPESARRVLLDQWNATLVREEHAAQPAPTEEA